MRTATTLTILLISLALAMAAGKFFETPMDAACNDYEVVQVLEKYKAEGYVVVSETEHPYRTAVNTRGNSLWGYCRFYLIDENSGVPITVYADISWNARRKAYFCTGCRVE